MFSMASLLVSVNFDSDAFNEDRRQVRNSAGKVPGKPCGASHIAAVYRCSKHYGKNGKLTKQGREQLRQFADKNRAARGLDKKGGDPSWKGKLNDLSSVSKAPKRTESLTVKPVSTPKIKKLEADYEQKVSAPKVFGESARVRMTRRSEAYEKLIAERKTVFDKAVAAGKADKPFWLRSEGEPYENNQVTDDELDEAIGRTSKWRGSYFTETVSGNNSYEAKTKREAVIYGINNRRAEQGVKVGYRGYDILRYAPAEGDAVRVRPRKKAAGGGKKRVNLTEQFNQKIAAVRKIKDPQERFEAAQKLSTEARKLGSSTSSHRSSAIADIRRKTTKETDRARRRVPAPEAKRAKDPVNINKGEKGGPTLVPGMGYFSLDSLLFNVDRNPYRDKAGRFASKAGGVAMKLAKDTRSNMKSAASHGGENVAAWAVGKAAGEAISQYAASKGIDPESARLVGASAVQGLAAVGIHAAKHGLKEPKKLAAVFMVQAAAAVAGKTAHSEADLMLATAEDRIREMSALFAGKGAGLTTASTLDKYGRVLAGLISRATVRKDAAGILPRPKAGLRSGEIEAMAELAIAAMQLLEARVDEQLPLFREDKKCGGGYISNAFICHKGGTKGYQAQLREPGAKSKARRTKLQGLIAGTVSPKKSEAKGGAKCRPKDSYEISYKNIVRALGDEPFGAGGDRAMDLVDFIDDKYGDSPQLRAAEKALSTARTIADNRYMKTKGDEAGIFKAMAVDPEQSTYDRSKIRDYLLKEKGFSSADFDKAIGLAEEQRRFTLLARKERLNTGSVRKKQQYEGEAATNGEALDNFVRTERFSAKPKPAKVSSKGSKYLKNHPFKSFRGNKGAQLIAYAHDHDQAFDTGWYIGNAKVKRFNKPSKKYPFGSASLRSMDYPDGSQDGVFDMEMLSSKVQATNGGKRDYTPGHSIPEGVRSKFESLPVVKQASDYFSQSSDRSDGTQNGWLVWFGGRRTARATHGHYSRSKAISVTREQVKRGDTSKVTKARRATDEEQKLLNKGVWVRTGPDGQVAGYSPSKRGQGPPVGGYRKDGGSRFLLSPEQKRRVLAEVARQSRAVTVSSMELKDISVSPMRFQYRSGWRNANPRTGTTRSQLHGLDLKSMKPLKVWNDTTGDTWVVDGHHRHSLLSDANVGTVKVQEIKASTTAEARAVGALLNIEKDPNSRDSRRFLRRSGLTYDDLTKAGLIKGEVIASAS